MFGVFGSRFLQLAYENTKPDNKTKKIDISCITENLSETQICHIYKYTDLHDDNEHNIWSIYVEEKDKSHASVLPHYMYIYYTTLDRPSQNAVFKQVCDKKDLFSARHVKICFPKIFIRCSYKVLESYILHSNYVHTSVFSEVNTTNKNIQIKSKDKIQCFNLYPIYKHSDFQLYIKADDCKIFLKPDVNMVFGDTEYTSNNYTFGLIGDNIGNFTNRQVMSKQFYCSTLMYFKTFEAMVTCVNTLALSHKKMCLDIAPIGNDHYITKSNYEYNKIYVNSLTYTLISMLKLHEVDCKCDFKVDYLKDINNISMPLDIFFLITGLSLWLAKEKYNTQFENLNVDLIMNKVIKSIKLTVNSIELTCCPTYINKGPEKERSLELSNTYVVNNGVFDSDTHPVKTYVINSDSVDEITASILFAEKLVLALFFGYKHGIDNISDLEEKLSEVGEVTYEMLDHICTQIRKMYADDRFIVHKITNFMNQPCNSVMYSDYTFNVIKPDETGMLNISKDTIVLHGSFDSQVDMVTQNLLTLLHTSDTDYYVKTVDINNLIITLCLCNGSEGPEVANCIWPFDVCAVANNKKAIVGSKSANDTHFTFYSRVYDIYRELQKEQSDIDECINTLIKPTTDLIYDIYIFRKKSIENNDLKPENCLVYASRDETGKVTFKNYIIDLELLAFSKPTPTITYLSNINQNIGDWNMLNGYGYDCDHDKFPLFLTILSNCVVAPIVGLHKYMGKHRLMVKYIITLIKWVHSVAELKAFLLNSFGNFYGDQLTNMATLLYKLHEAIMVYDSVPLAQSLSKDILYLTLCRCDYLTDSFNNSTNTLDKVADLSKLSDGTLNLKQNDVYVKTKKGNCSNIFKSISNLSENDAYTRLVDKNEYYVKV